MYHKRGQFYLLATLIIVAIIIGFAAITNYSKKRSSVKVNELGEELEIESEKVLDYIALQNENQLDNFLQNYSDYANENEIGAYFLFGNQSKITARIYKNVAEVYLNGNELTFVDPYSKAEVTNPSNIILKIEGINYLFDLKPGENFYFVLIQKIGEEKYVATNA